MGRNNRIQIEMEYCPILDGRKVSEGGCGGMSLPTGLPQFCKYCSEHNHEKGRIFEESLLEEVTAA